MRATNTAQEKFLSWNRQTYKRLKLALSLGLRRQIFVAVCDDLNLRNRLAKRLQADLGSRAISLNLNLNQPNPVAQITRWLKQHRLPKHETVSLTFQILGVELLTRQPAFVQGLFLRHLQNIERSISGLESSLLLWVPRPWFNTIQQSAPEFWSLHTAVFEFQGEPTPVSSITNNSDDAKQAVAETPHEEIPVQKQNLRHMVVRDFVKSNEIPKTSRQKSPSSPKKERLQAKQPQREIVFETNDDESPLIPTVALTTKDKAKNTQLTSATGSWADTVIAQNEQSEYAFNLNHENINFEEWYSDEFIVDEKETIPDLTVPTQLSYSASSQQTLQQEQHSPLALAEAYLQLGNHYRDRIQAGDVSSENLVEALQAYEQALLLIEQLPKEINSEGSEQVATTAIIPDVLNDLGNLYWMLSCNSTDPEQKLFYLENSITSYQQALSKISKVTTAETYAMIQNNLGAAYSDLARYRNPIESLQQSIASYQETLHYRSPQQDPLKYASTLNNLGTAYWHLGQQQEPVINLKMAIAAYTEALSYYHQEHVSVPAISIQWAMIQNNIGTVYWNLAQYEQPANCLQLAVEAYQNALKYRTPEALPAACAATQNNLGTAYWHLALLCQSHPEAGQGYIELCIAAYESAIALAQALANSNPPVGVGFDMFATYNNLGLAQYQLATDKKFSLDQIHRSVYLDAALENHLQAMNGFSEQPEEYQLSFSYVIKTIRILYREFGIQTQNTALSKVPAHLLPEIMLKL